MYSSLRGPAAGGVRADLQVTRSAWASGPPGERIVIVRAAREREPTWSPGGRDGDRAGGEPAPVIQPEREPGEELRELVALHRRKVLPESCPQPLNQTWVAAIGAGGFRSIAMAPPMWSRS